MKAITAKEAKAIAQRLNLDLSGDGRTWYATLDDESEIFSFDSPKDRDIFVKLND